MSSKYHIFKKNSFKPSLLSFFLFFLLIEIILAASVIVFFASSYRAKLNSLKEQQIDAVILQQKNILSGINEVPNDLIIISHIQGLRQYLSYEKADMRQKTIDSLLEYGINRKIIEKISVVNSKGREPLNFQFKNGLPASSSSLNRNNYANDKVFRKLSKSPPGCIYVFPLIQSKNNSSNMIRFVLPIHSVNRKFLGMIIVDYPGTRLLKELSVSLSYYDSNVFLYTPDGLLIKNENTKHKKLEKRLVLILNKMRQLKTSQLTTQNGIYTSTTVFPFAEIEKIIQNNPTGFPRQLFSAQKLQDFYWKIISVLPINQIYAYRDLLLLKCLAAFSVLSVLFVLFSWYISKALTARQNSEDNVAKLLKAVESCPVSVVITNERGLIEYANNHYLQSNGISESTVIGSPLLGLDLKSLEETQYAGINHALMSSEPWNGEVFRTNYQGQSIWEHTSISPIYDDNRGTKSFIAIIEDFTDRKNVERELETALKETRKTSKELEELSNQQSAILENTLIGIGLLKDGVLYWANSRLCEMICLDPEKDKGTSITRFFESNDIGNAVLELAKKAQNTNENFEIECRMRSCSNHMFWARIYGKGIIHSGFKNGILILLDDITEKKEFREALQAAKEEAENAAMIKSRFLASISHELRTPLNSIIGFSEILKDNLQEDKPREYLQAILASSKTLLSLINDILDISRIEANKMPINYSPVNPASVVKDIEIMYSEKALRRGLDLSVNIGSDIPNEVILDETRIRQILINLVDNAFKFTEKGFIRISLSRLPSDSEHSTVNLILKVEDSGTGVAHSEKTKIFKAFEQHGDHERKQYSGTGLGLAITKSFVDLMGGAIKETGAPGLGAIFEITLNNVPIASIAKDTVDTTIDPSSVMFESSTVLIAAPKTIDHDVIREFINLPGLTTIHEPRSRNVLDSIKSFQPNLVLISLDMRDIDGNTLYKVIKEKYPEITQIAYASGPLTLAEERRVKNYTDCLLSWPVSRSALVSQLCRILPHDLNNQAKESENLHIDEARFKDKSICIQELNEMFDCWKNISETLIVNDVEEFALDIMRIASNIKNEKLLNWARNLRFSAEKFDMKKIESSLKEFPVLAEKVVNE